MKWKLTGFGMPALLFIAVWLSACGPETDPEIIPKTNPNDSVAIVSASSEMPPVRISEDNPFTKAGIDLGRHLFYEKMLSGDNSQACADCHVQHLGFTDNEKAVSEGITGAMGNRNAMPIFNLMWHDNFFWDSRSVSMREQVLLPIQNPIEMNATLEDVLQKLNTSPFYREKFKTAFGIDVIDTTHVAKAMEQFLFSVISENSKFDRFNRGEAVLTDAELRGFERLKVKGCFNCHKGNLFMDQLSHNTGLDLAPEDEGLYLTTGNSSDIGKFKTPTLRNVMVTAPYMHDGRFKTIEEVLDFYDNDIQFNSPNVDKDLLEIGTRAKLSAQDIADVKEFLKALTDYQYLGDGRFTNPF